LREVVSLIARRGGVFFLLKDPGARADKILTANAVPGGNRRQEMQTLEAARLVLEEIESEADFVLFSDSEGVISEHCTQGEARMAFYHEAGRYRLGEHLPTIYQREEPYWVPLS
jgi:hypothetical protein